jgi:hypothetical protein
VHVARGGGDQEADCVCHLLGPAPAAGRDPARDLRVLVTLDDGDAARESGGRRRLSGVTALDETEVGAELLSTTAEA